MPTLTAIVRRSSIKNVNQKSEWYSLVCGFEEARASRFGAMREYHLNLNAITLARGIQCNYSSAVHWICSTGKKHVTSTDVRSAVEWKAGECQNPQEAK
jgi:hypothetical protein